MEQEKILFLCVHNSARSQMAEAFLKKYGAGRFHVESAGLEPGTLNPIVVEAMKEIDIDISGNQTNSVFDFFKEGRLYDYVITVCDKAATNCPVFPGAGKKLHWPFDDPDAAVGSEDEIMSEFRRVRDEIDHRITGWLKQL